MKQSLLMPAVAAAVLAADAAQADISISNKPTQNMDCVSGVCTATAQKAVLNVGNLQTMLASGDVTVKTGALARDIDVDQPLTWGDHKPADARRKKLGCRQSSGDRYRQGRADNRNQ